jgi:hypothetical protein
MARGSAVFGRNPRFIARHNMDLPGEDPQDDGDHVPELLVRGEEHFKLEETEHGYIYTQRMAAWWWW